MWFLQTGNHVDDSHGPSGGIMTAKLNMTSIIGRVARGSEHAEDLSYAEAKNLFTDWLHGDLPELAMGALWTAYRIKGESVEELRAFVHALEADIEPIAFQHNCQPVIFPSYNGTLRGANLLPLLAMTLTRCGVPVLMHGFPVDHNANKYSWTDHDPSGRVHSADILREFGLASAENSHQANSLLHLQGLSYLPVDTLHPGLGKMLALRQQLGVRSSVHTIVKLFNPFQDHAVHCAGVTHPPYLLRLQEYFQQEQNTALILRGSEGECFANPKRRPDLQVCRQGESVLWIEKDTQPLQQIPALPENSGISSTCRYMEAVLDGQLPLPSPLVDQALCLLCLSGRCTDMDSAHHHLAHHFSHYAA
ncbi:DNA-binding protein YbiB [Acidithiobacillus sp. 'AMD consortium']|nr:DNA-binding protein YbiB [Acidithiobacillus sp. 'AMD consortium']